MTLSTVRLSKVALVVLPLLLIGTGCVELRKVLKTDRGLKMINVFFDAKDAKCYPTAASERQIVQGVNGDFLLLRLVNRCGFETTVKIKDGSDGGGVACEPGLGYEFSLERRTHVICEITYKPDGSGKPYDRGFQVTFPSPSPSPTPAPVAPAPQDVKIRTASEIVLDEVPPRYVVPDGAARN